MQTKGDRLKALRIEHGWSQTDVAKKIRVSKQTLYKYENGIVTNIPSDKIEALAKLYGVEPFYIMGWSDSDSSDLTSPEREHIRKYRALDENGREMVDAVLDTAFQQVSGAASASLGDAM